MQNLLSIIHRNIQEGVQIAKNEEKKRLAKKFEEMLVIVRTIPGSYLRALKD